MKSGFYQDNQFPNQVMCRKCNHFTLPEDKKKKDFMSFSGGIEWEYWTKMA